MSRILRRPMFRGGPVDSRGTGITSNLGYEAGGRIGFDNGGRSRAGVGYTAAPTYTPFSEQAMPWLRKAPPPKEEINTTDEYITIGTDEGPGSRLGKRTVRNPDYEPPYRTKTITNRLGEERTVKIPFTKEEIAFSEGDFHPGQAELWRDPGDTSGTGNGDGGTGTPEKTDAEKLAEYQKMFEEAYGTGRGDDISNMLLSFAGKALKPEATVKSSFGEFFEDEAKRPSERKKYKDAATTAAINAYLTGQSSFQKFEDQMKMMKAGIDYKTDKALAVKKSWTLNDYVMNKDGNRSTSQALADGARDKVKLNPEYTGFKQIKSKHNTDDLLTDEYVGIIFMDEGTKEVFAVVMGAEGKPVKEPLY
jgi:hypothetical protein